MTLLVLLLSAAPAAAQRGPHVLALTDAATDAASTADSTPEWAHSLSIELAYVGGHVTTTRLDASAGPRDLAARVAAQVLGADAVVWLEPGSAEVRVALANAEDSYAAPVAADADPRTIALVASSLLEEAFATAVPTGPPLPEQVPHEQLTAPIEPAEQRSDAERPPVNRALPAAPERGADIRPFGAIGSGGMARANDIAFDPGTMIRALIGFRIGDHIQLQANLEAGLFRERVGLNGGGLELQPYVRLCPEMAGVFVVDSVVGLHLGGHACAALSELRWDDGFTDPFFDPFAGWNEALVIEAAGGGFVAIELRASRASTVMIRLDLDGSVPITTTEGQYVNRGADVLASLSAMVGFW